MADVLIKETQEEAELKAKQLPEPCGYRILCMVPKIDNKWGSGKLQKADESIRVQEQTTRVLYVAKMGPDCYKDSTRFPSGPWCKVGDFVLTRGYAGTRILIHGQEWRVINDDTVEGVVEDPRGISPA